MRRIDGRPPVSTPRFEPTLIDADILYRNLYCRHCFCKTQHIYCELLMHTGLGYACEKCAAEQLPLAPLCRKKRGYV